MSKGQIVLGGVVVIAVIILFTLAGGGTKEPPSSSLDEPSASVKYQKVPAGVDTVTASKVATTKATKDLKNLDLSSATREQLRRKDREDKETTAADVGGEHPDKRKLPNGGPGRKLRIDSQDKLEAMFGWKVDNPLGATVPYILDNLVLSFPHSLTFQADRLVSLIAIALGRTRSGCILIAPHHHSQFGSEAPLKDFLSKHAPAWYIVSHTPGVSKGSVRFVLRRRLNLFVFAVTGGKDRPNANWAEWTWGRRTPVQWYGDTFNKELRAIVDLHPTYNQDRFKYFTFKMSRTWLRVWQDFGPGAKVDTTPIPGDARSKTEDENEKQPTLDADDDGRGLPLTISQQEADTFQGYDWYVRLWDDNYFYEENLWNCLGRLGNPHSKSMMAGKIGWRYLSDTAIFPFAGGGAGWFLSRKGLEVTGPTMVASSAEKWFHTFRARKDIFLPHQIHDEDVFLTAWYHLQNVSFYNIPGVEHVSPGNKQKQRCVTDETLKKLRWDPKELMVFDYPAHEAQFKIEEPWYAFWKPIIWHYMSPNRLSHVESVLYADSAWGRAVGEFGPNGELRSGDKDKNQSPLYKGMPWTVVDKVTKPNRKCYPGFPTDKYKITPTKGHSVFEVALPDPQPKLM